MAFCFMKRLVDIVVRIVPSCCTSLRTFHVRVDKEHVSFFDRTRGRIGRSFNKVLNQPPIADRKVCIFIPQVANRKLGDSCVALR